MTDVWSYGHVFSSPGGLFLYKVIGPVCRLYDREELPYPCCRLSWRGKEPSWNRIGRRFVPDNTSRRFASYFVQLLGERIYKDQQWKPVEFVMTIYHQPLPDCLKEWWYTPTCKLKKFVGEQLNDPQ